MNEKLKQFRHKIDQIDAQLIALLDARIALVQEIGKCKKKNSYSVIDSSREKEILKSVSTLARHPLLRDRVKDVYDVIFDITRHIQ
jgi:monofunctional chorismate mutase